MNVHLNLSLLAATAVSAAIGVSFWQMHGPAGAREDLVSGNGRLEATEIDIATKFPGRIDSILVDEGDEVRAGQVVARMDTRVLQAQLDRANAEVRRAREAKKNAVAMVAQRKSELEFAQKEHQRFLELHRGGHVSQESVDRSRTATDTAKAAYAVAGAQVGEADAAISAALARVDEIGASIDESVLTAPRDGRVLFRVAEPGEVRAAGGVILSIIDLHDVYMTIFLAERDAGKVPIGGNARIVLDALPDQPLPATVSFVAPEAQFTPREVETSDERQKLAFRVKLKVLEARSRLMKPGMPGVGYVRLSGAAPWPNDLRNSR
jgi:HlyD family secretion protein